MWLTVVWLGQTARPLAVVPGFNPTAFTDYLGACSLWMDALFGLDIVGKAVDLFPKQCALHSLMSRWGWGDGGNERNWDCYVK